VGKNPIETVMGAVVLLLAGFFLVFAYGQADLGTVQGYPVEASFASIGGLTAGSDVRINGIKVGSVVSERVDPESFDAVVRMSISPNIHLPADTVASVDSEGLLGGKYMKLAPGRSTNIIPPNGHIQQTKNYQSLEELVGQIIFLATDNTGPKAPGPPPAPPPANPAGGQPGGK
jgi:phospholipid/cholesterol/gamma-HCH transport system substrate-binding protein